MSRPAESSKLYKFLAEHNIKPADVPKLMEAEGLMPIGKDRLSNFASGQSDLYTNAILRLCKILRCTPDDILDYEEFVK